MINQSGLFKVLTKSKLSLAKDFMSKYIDEIMPKITSTGKYISSTEDQNKINKLQGSATNGPDFAKTKFLRNEEQETIKKLRNKNENYKQENIFLDNKYRFKPSINGKRR
jgi:prophage antirepressor-like protein